MRIPTDKEIRALHEEFAPTRAAFELVHTHCEIVCKVAEQLLRNQPSANADLVRAGCLLHDIGVYRLYDQNGVLDHTRYIQHGVLGQDLLRDQGFPEILCRFCSHHTGVGLTREDVQKQNLPIPIDDYLADTPEEELVMYADKFHSKSNPPVFVSADTYAIKVRRFGDDKAAKFADFRARYGDPDLLALQDTYVHGTI
ncbi:HDIG domain-containing protein [Actinomadura barringtoniae]|uniref:HDIG domain-containing protein n=1 Tax=Actinomadura barringtoniae TaxID=1427535 RepID=A0A939T5J4_9ACTN|nr:HD domain-containing protein [Actinomadura barringtoniae]MBO2450698.1 HDIG domain-containing protein [Actinomadura barringtoniae]